MLSIRLRVRVIVCGVKALIKVGYACNDHCGFCHTLHVRHIDGSADEVHAKIERAKALGHTMVVLSGGEPTIRPELFDWAAHVARLDLDFGLVTNGRMLAYPDVVERLLQHRLKYVYLSLHGGSAKVHNLMVRSQAFEETYGALANLTGKGLDLHINCVITKQNMKHLRGVVDACLPYEDASLKFSMVEPKGGGDVLFKNLMPRVSEVAEHVRDALQYAREKGKMNVTHGAIPLCLMQGWEHAFDDLKTHRYATMIEVGESDFYPVDDLNKTHPAACQDCSLRGPCPGLYNGYTETFGDEELQPKQRGARSNSFNYSLVKVLESELQCPLRDGPLGITPWDRGRHLMVRNGRKLGIYRSDTRDFSDAEIAHLKHTEGQVYVDASRKAAPDDFARDLVKLQKAEVCNDCEHAPTCTGLYEPLFEDLFTRDDAVVGELLRKCQGDVLDVGCGESRYVELIRTRAESGELRYVGVDPDNDALARFAAQWPDAELHVGDAESLESVLGERQFDHVMLLRSWNHLVEPERVLTQLRARMRPGATVTIVDDVAFGLARTRAHTQRAQTSKAKLEHRRNHRAHEAAEIATRCGLEVLETRDVGPRTSTLWLVRAVEPSS